LTASTRFIDMKVVLWLKNNICINYKLCLKVTFHFYIAKCLTDSLQYLLNTYLAIDKIVSFIEYIA
jgi:hypothetical protein